MMIEESMSSKISIDLEVEGDKSTQYMSPTFEMYVDHTPLVEM